MEPSRSDRLLRKQSRAFTAEQAVFAAAALGTQKLLRQLKGDGGLPRLSDRLGELTRSNSEAIISVDGRTRRDFVQGVAITSSIHPEADTQLGVCRYGIGQNALFAMATTMVDGGAFRVVRFLPANPGHPVRFVRNPSSRRASERTSIPLFMQSPDNSLTWFVKRARLRTRQGTGEPNPTWIPMTHNIARRLVTGSAASRTT